MSADRPTKTLSYDNFTGGEFGVLGRSAPPNSFTARNMILYDDGSLGCRSGQKDMSPSGLVAGKVMGMGHSGITDADAWLCIADKVYGWNRFTGTGLFTYGGSLASTPTKPLGVVLIAEDTYVTSFGDKVYKLTRTAVPAGTITAIAAGPGGRDVTLYRDRLVVAGPSGNENRLRFSAAGDFTSWPAANYVDVGYGYGLSKIFAQRQHLTLFTQNETWLITGTLGVDETLRAIQTTRGPLSTGDAVLTTDGTIWYAPLFMPYPASFDGAQAHHLRHLSTGAYATQTTSPEFAAYAPDEPGIVMLVHTTDNNAWVKRNGVWTQHTFGKTMKYLGWLSGSGIFATDGGAAATIPKVYEWNLFANHPGSPTADARTQPKDGDSANAPVAYVYLPEHWSPSDREVLVRSVTVDFKKWNTGMAQTNHFDLTVDIFGRHPGSAAPTATSASQSFDEAGASSSGTGTRDRRVFKIGDQGFGAGFQVKLDACRGVAIIAVHVEYEESARPR